MTSEELKESCSMLSVVEQYGYHPNKKGFIHCPFHTGDKGASLKIYKDSYYCFGCGASGDIFKFVEQMEGCSFKEAFLKLGGEYPKQEVNQFANKMRRYHLTKQKETAKSEELTHRKRLKLVGDLMDIYRDAYKQSEPFSETWTDNYNRFQYMTYIYDYLRNKER